MLMLLKSDHFGIEIVLPEAKAKRQHDSTKIRPFWDLKYLIHHIFVLEVIQLKSDHFGIEI